MAASIRPTSATYTLHEAVSVDTTDHEDHTFSGVMFPVECKADLPIDHMLITSVSVRGMLGPMTVWVSKEEDDTSIDATDEEATIPSGQNKEIMLSPQARPTSSMAVSVDHSDWKMVYEREHSPSISDFVELKFDTPIKLRPNEFCGIYIHSRRPGDEAIVYDNQRTEYTHDDKFLRIRPGLAHLSNTPFGRRTIWGWGSPWRENREFVGQLSYGVVYKLWNPDEYLKFGGKFKTAARILFGCQRRLESPLSRLPDDVIFYILNLCRWDWYGDTIEEITDAKASTSNSSIAVAGAHSPTVARGRTSRPTVSGWPPLSLTFLSRIMPHGSRQAHVSQIYHDGDESDEDSDESWEPA